MDLITTKTIARIFWIAINLSCLTIALKDVRVTVPAAVKRGDNANLTCHYDLENDTLYSIKWYKGKREFYRYTPKEDIPMKVFTVYGITVERSMSNASNVMLTSMEPNSTGKYSCEVSADAPTFHTSIVSGELEVVDLPKMPPRIDIEDKIYSIGNMLLANCTVDNSKPIANLTWLLNNNTLRPHEIIRYNIVGDSTMNTTTSVLGVKLVLQSKHFRYKNLRLCCKASIYNIYENTTEKILELNTTSNQIFTDDFITIGSSRHTQYDGDFNGYGDPYDIRMNHMQASPDSRSSSTSSCSECCSSLLFICLTATLWHSRRMNSSSDTSPSSSKIYNGGKNGNGNDGSNTSQSSKGNKDNRLDRNDTNAIDKIGICANTNVMTSKSNRKLLSTPNNNSTANRRSISYCYNDVGINNGNNNFINNIILTILQNISSSSSSLLSTVLFRFILINWSMVYHCSKENAEQLLITDGIMVKSPNFQQHQQQQQKIAQQIVEVLPKKSIMPSSYVLSRNEIRKTSSASSSSSSISLSSTALSSFIFSSLLYSIIIVKRSFFLCCSSCKVLSTTKSILTAFDEIIKTTMTAMASKIIIIFYISDLLLLSLLLLLLSKVKRTYTNDICGYDIDSCYRTSHTISSSYSNSNTNNNNKNNMIYDNLKYKKPETTISKVYSRATLGLLKANKATTTTTTTTAATTTTTTARVKLRIGKTLTKTIVRMFVSSINRARRLIVVTTSFVIFIYIPLVLYNK